MTSFEQIREELRLKFLGILESELGTYTLSNGRVIPAIAVDNGGIYPPPGTTTEGLEAVIIPAQGIVPTPMLKGKLIEFQHALILKQWNPTKTTLNALILVLEHLSGEVKVGVRLPPNSELQTIEQVTIRFSDRILLSR